MKRSSKINRIKSQSRCQRVSNKSKHLSPIAEDMPLTTPRNSVRENPSSPELMDQDSIRDPHDPRLNVTGDSETSGCVVGNGFMCVATGLSELHDPKEKENRGYASLNPWNRTSVGKQTYIFSCDKPTDVKASTPTIYENEVLHAHSKPFNPGSSDDSPPSILPAVSSISTSSTSTSSSSVSSSSLSEESSTLCRQASVSSHSSTPSTATSDLSSSSSLSEVSHKHNGRTVLITKKDQLLRRNNKSSRAKDRINISNEEDDDEDSFSAGSVLEITGKYSSAGRAGSNGDQSLAKEPILRRIQNSTAYRKMVEPDDSDCSRSLSLFTNSSDDEDSEEGIEACQYMEETSAALLARGAAYWSEAETTSKKGKKNQRRILMKRLTNILSKKKRKENVN